MHFQTFSLNSLAVSFTNIVKIKAIKTSITIKLMWNVSLKSYKIWEINMKT
jgi:hypothetical protein